MDVAKSISHYARELGLATPHQHGGSRRRDVDEQFQRIESQAQTRRAAPPVEATVEGEWLGRSANEAYGPGPGFAGFAQNDSAKTHTGHAATSAYALSAYQETSSLGSGETSSRLVDYYA